MPEPTFPSLAADVLASYLAADPVAATYLGDHTHDARLPDLSPAAAEHRAGDLDAQLSGLDRVAVQDEEEAVDRDILRTALSAELLDLRETREAEWNPMQANPGSGLRALLSRDFAPLAARQELLAARLAAVPGYLAAARDRLGRMSRIHLDTALDQLAGTLGLLDDPRMPAEAAAAREAVVGHREWLAAQRDGATRDPRLGEDLFARKLALTLDTAHAPQDVLSRAERALAEVTDRITETASRLGGSVPDVLDRLAADRPDNATILGLCRSALAETTAFVRERDLVTVLADPVEVVEMPEVDRGVSVAYCRPPGPLEATALPTEFAVSPTPADWSAERVASFFREYNAHMIANLTVHEAMPGHALQLMHSNRHRGSTPVRAVWWSGSFVEGWAVYAEQLMADSGYRGLELRMQQLKMQLRMILNAILDVRFHCGDLSEDEALRLMRERGFQEEGEAVGKWRRVQLSSTQLSTYFVGYVEVRDLVTDLRSARPGASDREVHDAVLGAGSPPARHLRRLLGLPR